MVKSKSRRSPSTCSSSEIKANAKRWLTRLNSCKKKTSLAKTRKASIRPRSIVNVASPTMDRALEIQANLEPHIPSLVKLMLDSHVSGGFWLGLPKNFCDTHLPKHDATVILVDENEKKFTTKYLRRKTGLSGGWRGYSIDHKLVKEDVLVFQLIQPCVFKVHTVRANEVEVATNLVNLSSYANTVNPENAMPKHRSMETSESRETYCEKISVETSDSKEEPFDEYESADESERFVPEISNSIGLAEESSALKFEDVKSFESFKILVNGLVLDLEISKHLREKYYELCCIRNMYLHCDLVKHLDVKLLVVIISETVQIADAIRAAKPDQDVDCLKSWDKTLQAFEGLGMSVGFIRERLRVLMDLSCVPRAMVESRKNEIAKLHDEEREHELKLSNVRGLIEQLHSEIDQILMRTTEHELVFEEVARSPWPRAQKVA